jgi:hypothetical protein
MHRSIISNKYNILLDVLCAQGFRPVIPLGGKDHMAWLQLTNMGSGLVSPLMMNSTLTSRKPTRLPAAI